MQKYLLLVKIAANAAHSGPSSGNSREDILGIAL